MLAKMDTAISLNYNPQPEGQDTQTKGIFCLCDFTIVKNKPEDNTITESECDQYLPDNLGNMDEPKSIDSCKKYCHNYFNGKVKCKDINKC